MGIEKTSAKEILTNGYKKILHLLDGIENDLRKTAPSSQDFPTCPDQLKSADREHGARLRCINELKDEFLELLEETEEQD